MTVERSEAKDLQKLAQELREIIHDLAIKHGLDEAVFTFRLEHKGNAKVLAEELRPFFDQDVLHYFYITIKGPSLYIWILE